MLEKFLELLNQKLINKEINIEIVEFIDFENSDKKLVKEYYDLMDNNSKIIEDFYEKTENDDKNISEDCQEYIESLNELNIKADLLKTRNGIDGYLTTENFVDVLNLETIERYDAYGSGLYKFNESEIYLFDNYGDSDCSRNFMRFHTIFLLHKNSLKIEIGDVIFNPNTNTLELENVMDGEFPKRLFNYGIDKFCGKRTYYYHPDKKCVDMRVTNEIYKILPEKFKASEHYESNLSGCRISIRLNS